jgi:aspartate racemase
MSAISTIGVLGVNPAATNHLCSLIAEFTRAQSDQEHLPVVSYVNPAVPDLMNALKYGDADPLPELIRTAKTLEKAGADFIVIASILAHAYLRELRQSIETPILDLIARTASFTHAKRLTNVGVLAPTAALTANLFDEAMLPYRTRLLHPMPSDQALLMDAIYGDYSLKSGYSHKAFPQLKEITLKLAKYGAEAIVLGSSELSIAVNNFPDSLGVEVIDPFAIIANAAIDLSRQGFRMERSIQTLTIHAAAEADSSVTGPLPIVNSGTKLLPIADSAR